jgi:GTP-binding protein
MLRLAFNHDPDPQITMTSKTFIDVAIVEVRSGKGGNGMMHFRREKYISHGGPDGGDGGKGGGVVFEVDPSLRTLYPFRRRKQFFADDGAPGGRAKRSGRSGKDLRVLVPQGTLIRDEASDELIADLTEVGQSMTVAPGGRGGRGNVHFATSRNRAPRIAEKGEPGEERKLRLELKLIADIGIVGVPNAGKSTLLSVLTNAKPKIADYPFTTLEPNLGVAALDGDDTVVLADIPGLIEGAHEGYGLGHDFLRHVQRTRVLIHLIDGLAEDPLADFAQINSELALFDPDLAEKAQVVALNKMDLPEVQAAWPALEKELKKRGYDVLPVSAVSRENVRQLLGKAVQELAQAAPPEDAEMPVYRPEQDPRDFAIEREEDGWRVRGVSLERAGAMTYWEYEQSVRRFQRIMERLGITDALKEQGIQIGDMVFIGENELEWQE